MRVGETVVRAVLGTVATEHLLSETSPNGVDLAARQYGTCPGTNVYCGVNGCMPWNGVCCAAYIPQPPIWTRNRLSANGCDFAGETGTATRDTTACP